MFLKAGAVSLALLLASRLLGLLRESAQAAAFGTSGLADLSVLMLSLPDWIAGVLASGALAYVLLPAWAAQPADQVGTSQRRVAVALLAGGVAAAVFLLVFSTPALQWFAPGIPQGLGMVAAQAMTWTAAALPLAALAALWATRLQHERDFIGVYGASLVVNALVLVAIAVAAFAGTAPQAVAALGAGVLLAMAGRLAWLHLRHRPFVGHVRASGAPAPGALPPVSIWLWAVLGAGLPLALPFAARSAASQGGEGALATFNYAWKLVELPLILAIQLVATLALPAVSRAVALAPNTPALEPLRTALALAWTAACACAAALLVGAPAVAQLLFGWGRMPPEALAQVAAWAATAAWGLLPQAIVAVALTVLAAQRRLHLAALAYGVALLGLLVAVALGVHDGRELMRILNGVMTFVALATLLALGKLGWRSLPWATLGTAAAALGLVAVAAPSAGTTGLAAGLALATAAAAAVGALSWIASPDLRRALGR